MTEVFGSPRYVKAGKAFERRVAAALEAFGAVAQVPAAGGYADFVIVRPCVAVVECKRTLRLGALAQVRRYAVALGIATVVLVGQRLAVPPEALEADDVLTRFEDIVENRTNVVLWW